MIAIDTNLLVYAHRRDVPEHARARAALERARQDSSGWGVPFPVLVEFWSVVTGHAAAPRPTPPAQAAAFISDLGRAGAHVWQGDSGVSERLTAMAKELGVRGARIFDLHIALIARDNGARILWTHDSHFLSLPGLALHDPLGSAPASV